MGHLLSEELGVFGVRIRAHLGYQVLLNFQNSGASRTFSSYFLPPT